MKTLLFLIISLFVSSNVFAVTELLEATDLGRTHIDPISMTTFINYKTNYEYATPKVTYAKCKLDAEGKPIKNYFILKFEDEKGVIQNRYMVKSGSSCEEIRATEKAITSCEEHSALEFSVSDPDECKEGKCKELATPRVASTPLSINLGGNDPNPSQNIKNLQDEIAKCSPDKKFILVRDGAKSLVASLSDMSHCKLDKKRVITDGAKWDDGASPLTQIFTSNRSGFYIGDHTHYYFDESQKQWCIHFRPDLGSTAPSCGYNNMTRSIAFALPGETNISQKGAVKLSVDANGNPSAIIGHAKSETYSKTPELDESKSLLQISLSNKAGEGRKTVFESKPNLAGATTNTLTVSPSFSFGSKIAQPQSCNSNACLNAPKEVLDANSPLQCSKNENTTFAMPGTGKDTCYSCNGVSSGACGKEKVLLNKGNLLDYTQKINACRSSDSKSTEPVDATEDIIK